MGCATAGIYLLRGPYAVFVCLRYTSCTPTRRSWPKRSTACSSQRLSSGWWPASSCVVVGSPARTGQLRSCSHCCRQEARSGPPTRRVAAILRSSILLAPSAWQRSSSRSPSSSTAASAFLPFRLSFLLLRGVAHAVGQAGLTGTPRVSVRVHRHGTVTSCRFDENGSVAHRLVVPYCQSTWEQETLLCEAT